MKPQWKCEACCYMPAQALGGTAATWTSVLEAGFKADDTRSDQIACTVHCHGGTVVWGGPGLLDAIESTLLIFWGTP